MLSGFTRKKCFLLLLAAALFSSCCEGAIREGAPKGASAANGDKARAAAADKRIAQPLRGGRALQQRTACPSVPGYTFYPRKVVIGAKSLTTIKTSGATPATIAALCATTRFCNGFNTLGTLLTVGTAPTFAAWNASLSSGSCDGTYVSSKPLFGMNLPAGVDFETVRQAGVSAAQAMTAVIQIAKQATVILQQQGNAAARAQPSSTDLLMNAINAAIASSGTASVTASRGSTAPSTTLYDNVKAAMSYPSWDSRAVAAGGATKNYISPVKDQSGCGSCVAFAVTGAAEAAVATIRQTSVNTNDYSEQWLFFCGSAANARPSCATGWTADSASNVLKNSNIPYEANYPYDYATGSCTLKSPPETKAGGNFTWVPYSDLNQAKQHIRDYGSVTTYFAVYADFQGWRPSRPYAWDGVSQLLGYHQVLVVGYNDAGAYWIMKNSWSTGLGDGGYWLMDYNNRVGFMSGTGYNIIGLRWTGPGEGCPPVPSGYTFYSQQDLGNSDIDGCPYTGGKSVAELAAACDSTSGCTAFNLWQTQGDAAGPRTCKKNAALYNSLSVARTTVMADACQGIYVRNPARCPAVPSGYKFFSQQDLWGNDMDGCPRLGARSLADLAAACDSTPGCTAFNLWQQQGDAGGQSACLKNATYYNSLSVQSNGVMNNTCQGIFVRQNNTRAVELAPADSSIWGTANIGPGKPFTDTQAKWIWYHAGAQSGSATDIVPTFTATFALANVATSTPLADGNTKVAGKSAMSTSAATSALLHIIADDLADVFLNGNLVGSIQAGWNAGEYTGRPISLTLAQGTNTLSIRVVNTGGPAGLIASLVSADGGTVFTRTSSAWTFTLPERAVELAAAQSSIWGTANIGPGKAFTDTQAKWIWYHAGAQSGSSTNTIATFTALVPASQSTPALLHIIADDLADVFLNGASVGSVQTGWNAGDYTGRPLSLTLAKGINTLSIRASNTGGPAGLLASLVSAADGTTVLARTSSGWTYSANPVSYGRAAELANADSGIWGAANIGPAKPFFDTQAKWIWHHAGAQSGSATDSAVAATFTTTITAAADQGTAALLHIIADDAADVYLNGAFIVTALAGWYGDYSGRPYPLVLAKGTNTLSIRARNTGGPAGLLASVTSVAGSSILARTSSAWTYVTDFNGAPYAIELAPADSSIWGTANIGPGKAFTDTQAKWIWYHAGAMTSSSTTTVANFTTVVTSGPGTEALLHIIVDDIADVFLNGANITSVKAGWNAGEYTGRPIGLTLAQGTNTLSIRARNTGGPAGLIASLFSDDGSTVLARTSGAWTYRTN